MARSKKTTAMAVAAGVVTLGAGLGVATLASADPTATPSATPSASPSASPSQSATPDGRGPGGHRGPGEHGAREDALATSLADKLGVTEAKVVAALQKFREDNKPDPGATKPTPGTTRPDPTARDEALAKSLAGSLGVDEAKVKTALAEIRSAAQADRAAALKTKLDAAVKAGTLTQAEADAVTKAVDQGVINVGPR
jgi:hypothetical protein